MREALYFSSSRMPSCLETRAGTRAWPTTFTPVRPMSTIGSTASSSPTPASGSPSVERVSVSMTTPPVVPAVAAEPSTETRMISR